MGKIKGIWYKLPATLRVRIVGVGLVAVGVAAEWATKFLESIQGAPTV